MANQPLWGESMSILSKKVSKSLTTIILSIMCLGMLMEDILVIDTAWIIMISEASREESFTILLHTCGTYIFFKK